MCFCRHSRVQTVSQCHFEAISEKSGCTKFLEIQDFSRWSKLTECNKSVITTQSSRRESSWIWYVICNLGGLSNVNGLTQVLTNLAWHPIFAKGEPVSWSGRSLVIKLPSKTGIMEIWDVHQNINPEEFWYLEVRPVVLYVW